jgi:hypothetical protein
LMSVCQPASQPRACVRYSAHKQKPKPACWRHHNGSCVTLAVLGNSRALFTVEVIIQKIFLSRKSGLEICDLKFEEQVEQKD